MRIQVPEPELNENTLASFGQTATWKSQQQGRPMNVVMAKITSHLAIVRAEY